MPKRKTQEQFVEEVKNIFGNEYTVLGQYLGNTEKILIRHEKCGNEFLKIPKDMVGKKRSGCPYCNGNRQALYNEDWVKNNTPNPYKYIKGYKGMKQKCVFYCSQCQSEFEQLPSRLINQHIYGCNCCPTKKKTQEGFLEELGEALFEYNVLEDYVNIDTPIKFEHKNCGSIFKLSPEKFLHRYNKKYCPICYYKKSHGEIKIAQYLQDNKIEYIKEYSFKELSNKLHYDFYLPQFNLCIEFDGKQHYEAIDYFGGEEAFIKTQQRDTIKNEYCLNNNITLFRIPYTDIDNITFILDKIFKEKSSETIEKYKVY